MNSRSIDLPSRSVALRGEPEKRLPTNRSESVDVARARGSRTSTVNAMTIDVEDYFQVSAFEKHVDRRTWDSIDRRVERNVEKILGMLESASVQATFFTLGWVAERHPDMVRRIVDQGHELASHGYDHKRVNTLSMSTFRSDVTKAKRILEDISGTRVIGYRAPSYSFDRSTPWAHEVLGDTGHTYSSSIAPVNHDLYGIPDAPRFAYNSSDSRVLEVPISTVSLMGNNYVCAGGGWFRLYPYMLTRTFLSGLNSRENQASVFYFHPWEIDPDQPRLTGLDSRTKFRHYLNLHRVEFRIKKLLRDFEWGRMDDVFAKELREVSSTPCTASA